MLAGYGVLNWVGFCTVTLYRGALSQTEPLLPLPCVRRPRPSATGLLRMGVPSFYRWLADKYSKVVVDCLEVENQDPSEIDTSLPNPNGIEVCA